MTARQSTPDAERSASPGSGTDRPVSDSETDRPVSDSETDRTRLSNRETDPTAPPPDADLAIDASDVHITYADGTEAVRGVDLAVAKGEFFGFLGPNGAGKTTTIRTLVTLLHPTAGSVRIDGHDVTTEQRAVRESVGYMAQETSIDLELTPRENLRLACDIYGVPADRREDRIAELLDLVELRDVADGRAETFSGGMRKRLDAATVLVHRPPVVFLDEPTTGLDPEARRRLWRYFEDINDRGTTVFLTTQYLAEADRLCDRLAILDEGQVVARGTPASLTATVGTDTVTVTLEDPSDRDRAVVAVRETAALDVASVDRTADGLVVEADDARSATGDLFAAFADAGVAVDTFAVESPTLEEVFLAIAGDDGRGDNGAPRGGTGDDPRGRTGDPADSATGRDPALGPGEVDG